MEYDVVIGLEIHAQLKTKSKMFCRCSNDSSTAKPNENICPICLGMPGTLPVINKKAVEWTILTGLALNCQIAKFSKFDRKNYFYPDLPKGYQISQYDLPLCKDGFLEIEIFNQKKLYFKKIGINRIHLEEDAGKLIHPEGKEYSLVDLNRAGTPLMEIVTEPDISSSQEAKIFMQNLRTILRYLGVSEANMEEGNLRCDANISLKPLGKEKLGTKVEIKNINSFRSLERALDYEIKRQRKCLLKGEKIIQETRGWDEINNKTVSQRGKEESHDYRYFPEPDLPPLNFEVNKWINIENIKMQLPELPREKKQRFIQDYGLNDYDASILTSDYLLAKFFERCIEVIPQDIESTEILKNYAKKISNWLTVELQALLKDNNLNIDQCLIKPQGLTRLVDLIEKGEISGKIAKDIFLIMFKEGKDPESIIKKKNLRQISNKEELDNIINEVLQENQQSVVDYQKGKKQALGYLVGQVMQKTKGQANPQLASQLLKEKLEKE